MSKLIPDYVFESIYDITPALLQQHGVRGVLIDLDGTLASRKAALPPDTLAPFVRALHEAGLRVLVFSNNGASRVGRFCDALGVDYMSRAVKRLGLPLHEIAVVGDQIFTDVLGGNSVGALTCYVQTLDRRHFWVNIRYRFEHRFIERGRRRMEARERHE